MPYQRMMEREQSAARIRLSRRGDLPSRIRRRASADWRELEDRARSRLIATLGRWPCAEPKYLLVGAESSGTTAIADLLFEDVRGLRFLVEGGRQAWVWDVYKRVYQGQAAVRDFPRLQLFDAIKVPGFAMIIRQFREEFPLHRSSTLFAIPGTS